MIALVQHHFGAILAVALVAPSVIVTIVAHSNRGLERRMQLVEHELAGALAKLQTVAGDTGVDFAPRTGEVARRYTDMTAPTPADA